MANTACPSLGRGVLTLTLALCVGLTSGCSDDDRSSPSDSAVAGAAQPGDILLPGNAGRGNGMGGQPGSAMTPTPNDCTALDEGEACVSESYEGETIPLDIYIMFDQSGSMSNCVEPGSSPGSCDKTRLDAVREATEQFLRDPKSVGIGVGISFFGKQPIGQALCSDAEYGDAAVGVAQLPGNADAVMAALNAVEPMGETPTGPAIRGACEYASARKKSSGHEVVILLLTDGKPEAPITCQNPDAQCCPTLDDAVAAAEACYAKKPYIRTYVLGVGPLLGNLREIASAGGTEQAYLVESGDVSGEVLKALNRIRGDAVIPCEFQLPEPPPGQTLQYGKVNIKYADAACNSMYFFYVQRADGCSDSGGWYYDDPSNPKSIRLCPTSCDQVSVPGGQLFYTVGCDTRVQPR